MSKKIPKEFVLFAQKVHKHITKLSNTDISNNEMSKVVKEYLKELTTLLTNHGHIHAEELVQKYSGFKTLLEIIGGCAEAVEGGGSIAGNLSNASMCYVDDVIDILDCDDVSLTTAINDTTNNIQLIISDIADYFEEKLEGSSTKFFKTIEKNVVKCAKDSIVDYKDARDSQSYKLDKIKSGDIDTAMNYIGDQLSNTLIEKVHELPDDLQNEEVLIRSIEILLANLLNQKFRKLGDVHKILDSFSEHVHMAIDSLESRNKESNVIDFQ
jgi:hypothetical protein